MGILVVGGHARGIGKTAVVCAVLRAFRGLPWTAVKITPHTYKPDPEFEETEPGAGTDSARYLAAGASRALLARLDGPVVARLAGQSPWLVIESNSVVDLIRPDLFLFVVRPDIPEWKERAHLLFDRADGVVLTGPGPVDAHRVPVFRMNDSQSLPDELVRFIQSGIPGIPKMGAL